MTVPTQFNLSQPFGKSAFFFKNIFPSIAT
uniref:Uncharacterized protein n=1 Tax=Anguilla anguilla TaxID=7936 RepID=A0A0E9SFT7_ANGAN